MGFPQVDMAAQDLKVTQTFAYSAPAVCGFLCTGSPETEGTVPIFKQLTLQQEPDTRDPVTGQQHQ